MPTKHSNHFTICRKQFYHAESLNRFSRDFVPAAFDALKEDIHTGISPVVDDATHPDGLKRLNETLKHAATLTATTNPLKDRIHFLDLMGVCHHLANDGEVTWVPDE
ncbi:MAG: ABC-three component system protein [Desulfobulbus sp.]